MHKKTETSELRYRRLFEAAQDGILILDAETGANIDVNPFRINMLGYSREEVVERKLWEVGEFKDMDILRLIQEHRLILLRRGVQHERKGFIKIHMQKMRWS